MSSFTKLQNLVQTARLAARENSSGLDDVRASIYDLSIHALMNEVLTLGRLTSLVQAVRNGIEDCTRQASGAVECNQAMFEREAYRGLCTAALEGLTAVGLAGAEFCKLSDGRLSTEFDKALCQAVLECKQQLDQITIEAAWPINDQMSRIQTHWFDQLLQPIAERNFSQKESSAMLWSHTFMQSCGYEAKTEKSDIQANLMLLGLISSGALIGLRASIAGA
jgi:hypothetical protein